ncbi:hypothetical protein [Kineobactrum salinum]|uniref:DUF3108 domain-containing protein n=1 Tax=Kineobactrum salinum TaxID=2708301 RepID=A0A6C0U0S2_9GAMM|nr:hypothetical protein [Kineobactrum salinum]QIB65393.1 hypothetical protein G3T16_08250 [Kineobactrum salinum]
MIECQTGKQWLIAALLLAGGLVVGPLLAEVKEPGTEARAESHELVGEAYDPQSDELLYREFYRFGDNGWPSQVVYRLPDGTLITEKLLLQGNSPLIPSFVQRNHLTGRLIQVDVDVDKLTLLYRENETAESEQTTLSLPARAVVDAGFDAFVQRHWQELLAGDELSMEFLATTRQRFVGLVMQRHECAASKANHVCLRIGAANRLLRWLLDPIDLVYRRDNRKLQQFTGVSNLVMAGGETPKVIIHYDYSAGEASADSAD